MNNIRIYNENELQYKKLKLFAEMVSDKLEKGKMTVETTYFDYGQDWKYSALITYKEDGAFGHWQSFCPRDYELILYTDSMMILDKMATYYADEINKGKISVYLFENF